MENEIELLRKRVAQLMQRVMQKDQEFAQERSSWKAKERQYQREIRELKAVKRAEEDAEF